MRASFCNRTVQLLALITFTMTCAAARAADKPIDLDAELTAALEAWSLKAMPGESYYNNDRYADLKKAYHEGFHEGIALLLKRESANDDYRGLDSVKQARSAGLFASRRALGRAEAEAWLEIAQRLKAAPDQRVGKSVEVLAIALRDASVEDVAMLLDRGADVEGPRAADKSRPLHLAAYSTEKTALLLKRGAKPNTRNDRGMTPLHRTDVDSVKLLLEHGADVTLTDDLGRTPLHSHTAAVLFNANLEAVKLLLKHKADVSARDKTGTTPLHLATDKATAALLVKHGAKVTATNNAGDTPLHLASSGDLVDFLIEQGGDVEAVNIQGDTPLHTATTYEAVIALLKHDADPDAVNKKGKRAADVQRVSRVLAYKKAHFQQPSEVWARAMLKVDGTIPVNLRGNKLIDAFEYIQTVTRANLYFDRTAIEAHVELDTPITLVIEDSPAGDILSAVLEQAAKGKFTWQVDPHGIVLVTTPARMESLAATSAPTRSSLLAKTELPVPTNYFLQDLEFVFKHIKETTDVSINVDWTAMEKAGIKRNSTVTSTVKNVALYRSMELILFDTTEGKAIVNISKDALYISTPDAIDAFMKK